MTKLRKFQFLNIIYTTWIKVEMIIILLINIETLFSKNIRFKASLKYKIFVLQL